MSFANFLRSKKLVTLDIRYIKPNKIQCQYNPDRFRYWSEACGANLDISNNPFYQYLASGETTKYRKLFRLYGRSEKWITDNIKKFDSLCSYIALHGFNQEFLPVILEKPVIENLYNSGYEIYEGHRRMSIISFLGLKQEVKVCQLL